jgi:hypothetical protein
MQSSRLLAAALAIGLAGTALAAPRGKMVMGPEAAQRTNDLVTSLTWHTSLDAARATAAREGKLVFWVQMLGQIDGST